MSLKELLKQRKDIFQKKKNILEALDDYFKALSAVDLEIEVNKQKRIIKRKEKNKLSRELIESFKLYLEVINQIENAVQTLTIFNLTKNNAKNKSKEFQGLLRKEKKALKRLEDAFGKLQTLGMSSGVASFIDLVEKTEQQFEDFKKTREELVSNQSKISKELEKASKRTVEQFQKELDKLNKEYRGLKFSFLTADRVQTLNSDLTKARNPLAEVRKEQEQKNKNKNPKKEDFKKKLKEFEKLLKSGAKSIQQLRFFYEQILNLVPIRVLLEEAIRCMLKKIGYEKWVQQLCKTVLNSLANDFVLNALIKLSYLQFSLSGDSLRKEAIPKLKDGKLNEDYVKALESRVALDENGLQVKYSKPEDGPAVVYANRRFVSNFQKPFSLGTPDNPVDKYINLLKGTLKIKKVSLEKMIEIQKKDGAYTVAVAVAKSKLGEDLSGEAPNKNNLLLRISETRQELADTLFELYDAQELCESLFDNVSQFAEAVLQFITMFSWEELWKSAPAIPVLKLPDFNFGIIDPNAKWDKVLKETLIRLGLELAGQLAGVLAQLLNQTCQDDLPGEVDIRTLNPIPLGELFPEYADCASSLEKILDELSLILTPSEICLLLEGEISAVTFPVNKDGFILNLHEYNVKEFARFETTTLTDLIERYAKQRYPKCSYIFGDPESILEFFKQFAEEAVGCPFPDKPRFFCENDNEEELNKLRLQIFCDRYDQEQLDCLIQKTQEMRQKRLAELMNSIYDEDFFNKFIPDVEAQLPIPTSTSFLIDNTLDTIFEVVKMNYDREIDSFVPAMITYEASKEDPQGVPPKPEVAKRLKSRLEADAKRNTTSLNYSDSSSLLGFEINSSRFPEYIPGGYKYDFSTNLTYFDFTGPAFKQKKVDIVPKFEQKVFFTEKENKFLKQDEGRPYHLDLKTSMDFQRDLFLKIAMVNFPFPDDQGAVDWFFSEESEAMFYELKRNFIKQTKERVMYSPLFDVKEEGQKEFQVKKKEKKKKEEKKKSTTYFAPIQKIDLDPIPTPRQKAIEGCDVSILNITQLKQDLKLKYLRFSKDGVGIEQLLAENMLRATLRIYVIDFLLRGIFSTTSLKIQENILGDDIVAELLYGMFKYQINLDILENSPKDRLFVLQSLLRKAKQTYDKEFKGTKLFGEELEELSEEDSLKFLLRREVAEVADRIPRVTGVGLYLLDSEEFPYSKGADTKIIDSTDFYKDKKSFYPRLEWVQIFKQGSSKAPKKPTIAGLQLRAIPWANSNFMSFPLIDVREEIEHSKALDWSTMRPKLFEKAKKAPEYTLLSKAFGFDQLNAYLLALNILGITVDSQIGSVFSETRKSMIRIFRTSALENKDFTYQDPLVKNGVSANLKGDIDIAALILPLILKAPWIIVKNLAEATDPNTIAASSILRIAIAAVEAGISVSEFAFSTIETAGVAAEITKGVFESLGTWNELPDPTKIPINLAIKAMEDIPKFEDRKETYELIRLIVNSIPAIVPGVPLSFAGLIPTPITFVYWAGDLIEKVLGLIEGLDAENIQKDDKLKEKAEKAKKLFVDKMSNYGIDVEAYERLCQPERDSKKDDDKVDEEPKAPKPNKNPCD